MCSSNVVLKHYIVLFKDVPHIYIHSYNKQIKLNRYYESQIRDSSERIQNFRRKLSYFHLSSVHSNLPYTLSCRGPRTQLRNFQASAHTVAEPLPTTRTLDSDLQILQRFFPHKPIALRFIQNQKTTFYPQSLTLFIHSHGPRTMGKLNYFLLFYIISWADNPLT